MTDVIRAATEVRFFMTDGASPLRAVVVTPYPKGQGLDLLVENAPLGYWTSSPHVLGPNRPERATGDPYWLPAE